tara:strand:+ start:13190 stop:13636 length:447 start_codon:yes stop_codon:yes gene_type:complete
MPLCIKCNREVCFPCVRGTTHEGPRKIVVAADHQLLQRACFQRIAIATAALTEELSLSRRHIPDWIADVIYAHEGEIIWAHGGPFIVSDTAIDDAFNNDGSFRWLSSFVRFAEEPPKQAPQYRVITRLRLIELAFQIARPDTARHFRR